MVSEGGRGSAARATARAHPHCSESSESPAKRPMTPSGPNLLRGSADGTEVRGIARVRGPSQRESGAVRAHAGDLRCAPSASDHPSAPILDTSGKPSAPCAVDPYLQTPSLSRTEKPDLPAARTPPDTLDVTEHPFRLIDRTPVKPSLIRTQPLQPDPSTLRALRPSLSHECTRPHHASALALTVIT